MNTTHKMGPYEMGEIRVEQALFIGKTETDFSRNLNRFKSLCHVSLAQNPDSTLYH
ncbi:MAG: hypothetical protein JXR07_15750 [Reichenbachiella sp.]